jgi:hypothetical protein
MKSIKFILVGLILSTTPSAHALWDIGANFSYARQVYGVDRDHRYTSRTWRGSVAYYFWTYTGLEVNYSYNEQRITDERDTDFTDGSFTIIKTEQRVYTQVVGYGIRQLLAPKDWIFTPYIAGGYAKQKQINTNEYIVKNNTTGQIDTLKYRQPTASFDSIYATAGIEIKITKRLRVTGSISTVFEAWYADKAKDNLRYLAGVRWFL